MVLVSVENKGAYCCQAEAILEEKEDYKRWPANKF